jgi:hypothetical protein
MQWQDIERVMHTLEKPVGGFTMAHRGVVTMPDGKKVFVKLGTDNESKHWAQKEIAVYTFLQRHHYPFIPEFLAHNEQKTGFALEAITSENGWDWKDQWDDPRLAKTLEAMDLLATISPNEEEKALFGVKGITGDADGWRVLQNSDEKQRVLRDTLTKTGHQGLAGSLNILSMARKSTRYVHKENAVVHQDVRADNCAWSASRGAVKLIDWSWTQFGDRTIDRNAVLVHVYRSGFDITAKYHMHLDAAALEWLAGFWLNASTNPVRPDSPHLRDYQLESGVAALELAKL